MIQADFYVHTNFSNDCFVSVEPQIKSAIKSGLKFICFTDHCDMHLYSDKKYVLDINSYVSRINNLKEKYKNQISVLCGIEIGLQPNLKEAIIDNISDYDFDFIIESLLLENGVDVNNDIWIGNYNDGLLEIEYVSPLQYAANWGNSDAALLLIDKGANFEYSDIPQIFSRPGGYSLKPSGSTRAKILCAIYDKDSSAVGERLQSYKDKRRDGVHHDKIEPIFRNVLSKHILPKVQNEQIKNQLNNFLSGTDNSVEDISAQADIQNDLQNSRERQDEVVTIENISKAQKETEGLSISSN